MKNTETRQLMAFIQRQNQVPLKKQILFQPVGRAYQIIKAMFNSYKKQHELQLLQQQVFKIKNKDLVYDVNYKSHPVNSQILFSYHKFTSKNILTMIEMKEYLSEQLQLDFIYKIISAIKQLDTISQVVNCYRKLLQLDFLANRIQRYQLIEQKMINRIVNMNIEDTQFPIVTRFVLSLPRMGQKIRVFISLLYEKVQILNHFKQLFIAFLGSLPQQPSETDIQSLFRICCPKSLKYLNQVVEQGGLKAQRCLQIAQAVAINKLHIMDLAPSEKTNYTLNFIVELVKLGRPIWYEIIEWEHRASQVLKDKLKNQLEEVLSKIFEEIRSNRNSEKFAFIVDIIEKITIIDTHSEIALIFVKELMKFQRQFLSHRSVRKFLALKILNYSTNIKETDKIFSKQLKYIETIIEMLNFQDSSKTFYKHLAKSAHINLQFFLQNLSEKMPNKYRQYFIKMSQACQGEIIKQSSDNLKTLLTKFCTQQQAIILIKDLSLLNPNVMTLPIYNSFIQNFKNTQPYSNSNIKKTIVRAINVILIRTPKDILTMDFKKQLPLFINEYLKQDTAAIFKNVSSDMAESLKQAYERYYQRKTALK